MLDKIKEVIEQHKFDHYGWTHLERPLTLSYYEQWLAAGMHADMNYLERHLEQKRDPQKLLSNAQTAFVFAQNYVNPQGKIEFPKNLKVALYAKQSDYHYWFKEKLQSLSNDLKKAFPNEEFFCFTDSSPVLERELAYRAGLGWVGKNTCLINEKRGSLFFLGEIYSTINLKSTTQLAIAPDRCGTCTRCIDACPTNAIVEPRKLDARKCISYWTIEAKSIPPKNLSSHFNGWYFGCDICQTVCPWNQKVWGAQIQVPEIKNESVIEDLTKILNATNEELKTWFKGTPLERAKPWAHKRNAIIVAVNYRLKDLISIIQNLNSPQLVDLKTWALKILEPNN